MEKARLVTASLMTRDIHPLLLAGSTGEPLQPGFSPYWLYASSSNLREKDKRKEEKEKSSLLLGPLSPAGRARKSLAFSSAERLKRAGTNAVLLLPVLQFLLFVRWKMPDKDIAGTGSLASVTRSERESHWYSRNFCRYVIGF